jgi:sulfate permease, SulP family
MPQLLSLKENHLIIGALESATGSILNLFQERWHAIRMLGYSDLQLLMMPALTLSALLSIDTLKTCVVLDAITRSRHNSNRELMGQGIANVTSALIGGMPGSGTMGPTLVNVNSGGRHKLSGILEGVFVLIAFLIFSRWIAWVPIAALAGILMVVAVRMIDWKSFQLLNQTSTLLDFGVIASVIFVAFRFSLIAASATGLILAILLFIREQIRGTVVHRKMSGSQISSTQHRLPEEQKILERKGSETVICELEGSLFFGTTDKLQTQLEKDLKQCRYLILDMRRVVSVDFTAVHMLEQFEAVLKERNGFLIFSRLPVTLPTGQDLRAYFKEAGLTSRLHNVMRFDSLDDALQWVEDRILREEGFLFPSEEKPLDLAQIELFRECDPHVLDALSHGIAERSYQKGDLIFQAGEKGDELYLIRSGIIRIVLRVEENIYHNLASFGRGDFFGEMAFLDRGTRSADALATSPVELFVISRSKLDEISQAYPDVGEKLFARLARSLAIRLRRTDRELKNLYEE